MSVADKDIELDKIKNEYIRVKVELTSIVKKIIEYCFRWFGHMQRRLVEALVKRVYRMDNSLIVNS